MKTYPSLIVAPLRLASLVALGFLIMIAGGCASRTNQKNKTTYGWPPPPAVKTTKVGRPAPAVVDATAVMRQNAVRTRTGELLRTGNYKTTADARKAAEDELGSPDTSASNSNNNEWAEYARGKKQRISQAKFEADLDKMKRKP